MLVFLLLLSLKGRRMVLGVRGGLYSNFRSPSGVWKGVGPVQCVCV